jgi:hypothetical protein
MGGSEVSDAEFQQFGVGNLDTPIVSVRKLPAKVARLITFHRHGMQLFAVFDVFHYQVIDFKGVSFGRRAA